MKEVEPVTLADLAAMFKQAAEHPYALTNSAGVLAYRMHDQLCAAELSRASDQGGEKPQSSEADRFGPAHAFQPGDDPKFCAVCEWARNSGNHVGETSPAAAGGEGEGKQGCAVAHIKGAACTWPKCHCFDNKEPAPARGAGGGDGRASAEDGKLEAQGERLSAGEQTTAATSPKLQTESGVAGFDPRNASPSPPTPPQAEQHPAVTAWWLARKRDNRAEGINYEDTLERAGDAMAPAIDRLAAENARLLAAANGWEQLYRQLAAARLKGPEVRVVPKRMLASAEFYLNIAGTQWRNEVVSAIAADFRSLIDTPPSTGEADATGN